ncbi:unnamed protein product, partial [Symbiodinium sp. KB8]
TPISDNKVFNAATAGCASGAVLGARSGTVTGVVGGCLACGTAMAAVEGAAFFNARPSARRVEERAASVPSTPEMWGPVVKGSSLPPQDR